MKETISIRKVKLVSLAQCSLVTPSLPKANQFEREHFIFCREVSKICGPSHLRRFRGLFSPSLQKAVECVLTSLNDNGYLEESAVELAARCKQSLAAVKKAEEIVRELEPPGIAARSLSECLAIQLERKGETGLAFRIVQDFLEDMAHEHYNHIAAETGASRKEIQAACRMIRSLNPKPGAPFSRFDTPHYIIPDLLVRESDEKLIVTANDGMLPTLVISAAYRKILQDSGEAEVQRYLTEKFQQADWIVRGIEQRKNALLRCGECIARRQKRFFREGPEHLMPMTQIEIADTLGIHESTVSRAVRASRYNPFDWQPAFTVYQVCLPGPRSW